MIPLLRPADDTTSTEADSDFRPGKQARDAACGLPSGPLRDGILSFARLLALAAIQAQRYDNRPANDR